MRTMNEKQYDNNNTDNEPSEKKRKSNDEHEHNQHQSIIVTSDVQLKMCQSSIFNLNIDCFEEVFDYLSLKQLAIVGETSKRMQQIVGHCFRQSYEAARATFYYDFDVNYVHANFLIDFIRKIRVLQSNEAFYEFLRWNRLHSLVQIRFYDHILTKAKIECMQVILGRVEAVELLECKIESDFFETFLMFCSNLRRLCVDGTTIIGTQYNWLLQHYPLLEHFQLLTAIGLEIEELATFFQLNPNIKRLSTGAKFFWFNQQTMTNTNLKLNTLAIKYDKRVYLMSFCRLLNKLYDSGFYKKLHLYFDHPLGFNQKIIEELKSVKALVKVAANSRQNYINLSCLINLEELCITCTHAVNDLEHLPNALTNLRRIYFLDASTDDILPFIHRAPKLNKIKVRCLRGGIHFDEQSNVIDLKALNEEREKVGFATKITFYVKEDVYLATKWTMIKTEFNLIEMRRIDSYDWNMEFQIDTL
ncbi:uncharacterized protein LOC116344599 [Contarinia nasturtii]|uniref:uncharacterized protein LOC116344599 n=1 Tax=Contarinia nasturtii TaxID=265458 RepID=UPI0012D4A2DA|nr:uncharacterized protein LOC116344599 [Contarinia nasturtii]